MCRESKKEKVKVIGVSNDDTDDNVVEYIVDYIKKLDYSFNDSKRLLGECNPSFINSIIDCIVYIGEIRGAISDFPHNYPSLKFDALEIAMKKTGQIETDVENMVNEFIKTCKCSR